MRQMKNRRYLSFALIPCLLLPLGHACAVSMAEIPEAEIALIRAIGFFEAPRVIARVCGSENPASADTWNREVDDFERRRATEADQVRRLFWSTYGIAVPADEARGILAAKVERRLADEAAAYHVGTSTLCAVVSLFGGKRAFESKGFEETLQTLSGFEKQGVYDALKTSIENASPSERAEYRDRLIAYEPKHAH
jgi:hypothetical protein